MEKIPVAVQMYTLRDAADRDFVGTLKRVAALGYAGVELAGYGGLSASDLKALLADLGLGIAGAHTGLDIAETEVDALIDFHLELGNKYLVAPYMSAPDADGWRKIGQRLNVVGAKCRAYGLQVCYHNHAHEFESYDGETGLQLLFANSDAANVQAELDLYWVTKGGQDPVQMIKKYSGRLPLLHCKDQAPDGSFAEVGNGTLDWPAIFSAAPDAGVQWYIVEQDSCPGDCFDSVETSIRNLRKFGVV